MPERIELPITTIPDNLQRFMHENYCTLVVSVCTGDGINGYGMITFPAVEVKMFERICSHCGYSDLFSTQGFLDSRHCYRHAWGKTGWSTVFAWSPLHNHLSLEECFEDWLKLNSNPCRNGYYSKSFGRFGRT